MVVFSGVPAGSYLVQASAEGVKTASELVNISPDADGQRYRVSLTLHFEPEPLGNFTGVWDTTWGEMRLTQSGNSVTGTYEYSNGTIRGKVEGLTLKGTWAQDEGTAAESTGGIEFNLSPSGNSWSGTWDCYSADGSGEWTGTRVESVWHHTSFDLHQESPRARSYRYNRTLFLIALPCPTQSVL